MPDQTTPEPATPETGDKYVCTTDAGTRTVTVTQAWSDDDGHTAVAFTWHDDKHGRCDNALPLDVFFGTYKPAAVITSDVAAHVLWQAGRGGYPAGSFTTKLLDAWDIADNTNNAKLAEVFPDYAAAFVLLGQQDGVDRLRAIAGGESR